MVKVSIRNALLDAFFARGDAITAIPTSGSCYIGMSTTTPTESGDTITNFTEPAASTGYKRVRLAIRGNTVTYIMSAAAEGEIKNGTNFIFFNEATAGAGGFGTLTHFGLFSAETGGTPVLVGALTNPVTVAEEQVLIFRPGNLKVSME